MYFAHFAKCHGVQPVALRKISSIVFLDQLKYIVSVRLGLRNASALLVTFSSRPISSLWATLLGVAVSLDPSASRPGHSNNLCFPRLSPLYPQHTSSDYYEPAEASTYHFLPNSLKVVPATGIAFRGPPVSHTVKVSCEFRGRSQYRIGSVIHSFQLGTTTSE